MGRLLRRTLRFGESIGRLQAAARRDALLAPRLGGAQARALEEGVRQLCFAVEELGAKLDRNVEARDAARPAAAADALARLEHEHRAPGTRQLIGGGKSRGAGANHHEVGCWRGSSAAHSRLE